MTSDARRPDQDRPDQDRPDRDEDETSDVSPGRDDRLAQDPLEQEFSVALAHIIESAADDPARLRNTIYELARIMLQREAWQTSPGTDSSAMRRRTLALE